MLRIASSRSGCAPRLSPRLMASAPSYARRHKVRIRSGMNWRMASAASSLSGCFESLAIAISAAMARRPAARSPTAPACRAVWTSSSTLTAGPRRRAFLNHGHDLCLQSYAAARRRQARRAGRDLGGALHLVPGLYLPQSQFARNVPAYEGGAMLVIKSRLPLGRPNWEEITAIHGLGGVTRVSLGRRSVIGKLTQFIVGLLRIGGWGCGLLVP